MNPTTNSKTRYAPRRSYFYLLSAVALCISCGDNPQSDEKASRSPDSSALEAVVVPTGPLYAWAVPLKFAPKLDHTWVTTTSSVDNCPPANNFWYCWGVCHRTGAANPTARLLGSRSA